MIYYSSSSLRNVQREWGRGMPTHKEQVGETQPKKSRRTIQRLRDHVAWHESVIESQRESDHPHQMLQKHVLDVRHSVERLGP